MHQQLKLLSSQPTSACLRRRDTHSSGRTLVQAYVHMHAQFQTKYLTGSRYHLKHNQSNTMHRAQGRACSSCSGPSQRSRQSSCGSMVVSPPLTWGLMCGLHDLVARAGADSTDMRFTHSVEELQCSDGSSASFSSAVAKGTRTQQSCLKALTP